MSKRGLSREEKRTKMLEIFHETSEFFTLKELEKVAPKQKGIVQQSVKEILDELVSDGLVQFDKILLELPQYSWCESALDKARADAAALDAKVHEARLALQTAMVTRQDTPDRRALLATLSEAREQRDALKAELAAFGAADPVKYELKRGGIEIAKRAASLWTDNTMILWSLVKAANPGVDDAGMRAMLEIPDDWEDKDFS